MIKITVINKEARGDGQQIVCNNTDYKVKFYFDDEWDGRDPKTMRVVFPNGNYDEIVFTGDECDLPEIQDKGSITIGVYAGNLHTTTPAFFYCARSILNGAGQHTPPTPDVYNQIIALIEAGAVKGDTGNGIDRIEKTGSDENIDYYTIYMTDGSEFEFTVTNAAVDIPEPDAGGQYLQSFEDEETGEVYTEWGDAPFEVVDLTEDSEYHKGKISVTPEYDIPASEFDTGIYRALLDFENGTIHIQSVDYRTFVDEKEITNGFVFTDLDHNDYDGWHRPTVAWAFNGSCGYAPVVETKHGYKWWVDNTGEAPPYKCVANADEAFTILPAPPTSQGVYVLGCEVDEYGNPTYYWEM